MSIFAFIALPAIGPTVAAHVAGVQAGVQAVEQAQRTERAYRHVKDIVDQLEVTREREAQWAAAQPAPPVWVNLAKDPLPRHLGRVCRFRVGDMVLVAHQSGPHKVTAVHCHEVHPAGWSHCMGDDALYELDDGQQRGDHELAFASSRDVFADNLHAVFHQQRLIGLTRDGRPVDLEHLSLVEFRRLSNLASL